MKFSRIGIDFDNTIIIYDDVFYHCAIEFFNMPRYILADKPSVRDYFWNYCRSEILVENFCDRN